MNVISNDDPTETEADSGGLSRRRVLQLAGLGAAGLAVGSLATAAPASAHGPLARHDEIWNAITHYDVTGQPSSFDYNPAFYGRLETFLAYWYANTPVIWRQPLRVWTYGAHYDGRVSEAHNYGRGFDLTRIVAMINGAPTKVFDGHYDEWRSLTGAELATTRRRYWATSACAHYHFRNVLTYPYNTDHWNHIHIDNLVSGTGNSHFDTGSEAQVKHVQACCTYIWGYATAIDGVWGTQSDANSRRVLSRIGRTGGLTSSQPNWLEFNRTSVRFGSGRQDF
ncbi:MAG: hypothetical protein DLM58_21280 [Pseudonocardiales bacterium]|nr:MAG: hypothetical protein DLM58_21280 [Pseudonocardiales bacterium]